MIDMTGRTYGRLTAQWPAGRTHNAVYWLFLCVCGRLKTLDGSEVRIGRVRSCGCWESKLTHGCARKKRRTPEYICWITMIRRCEDPKADSYKYYGLRGISVCKRWRKSFVNFLKDMGTKPTPKHSIDRINNDGNYSPKNCRWATALQQVHNRRKPCSKNIG